MQQRAYTSKNAHGDRSSFSVQAIYVFIYFHILWCYLGVILNEGPPQ